MKRIFKLSDYPVRFVHKKTGAVLWLIRDRSSLDMSRPSWLIGPNANGINAWPGECFSLRGALQWLKDIGFVQSSDDKDPTR